jgi:hypothetical protein
MKELFSLFLVVLLLSSCSGGGTAIASPPQTQAPESAPLPTAAPVPKPVWGETSTGLTAKDAKTGDTVLTAAYILPGITNASGDTPQWTAINDYYAAEGQSLLEDARQLADPAQEDYTFCRDNGYDFYPYTDEQSFELKLQTERHVSILRSHYFYQGGAHGEVYLLADTFDMTSGERLDLNDLFVVPPRGV